MLISSFLVNVIYTAAYGGGYCQETMNHVTLLWTILLAVGPLAASPLSCLWAGDAVGCAQAQHLTNSTSCLEWRDTPDVLQTPSFFLWGASGNPSHFPHSRVRPGGPASSASHPHSSLPLQVTRGVSGMRPSPSCQTPCSQGDMMWGLAW